MSGLLGFICRSYATHHIGRVLGIGFYCEDPAFGDEKFSYVIVS